LKGFDRDWPSYNYLIDPASHFIKPCGFIKRLCGAKVYFRVVEKRVEFELCLSTKIFVWEFPIGYRFPFYTYKGVEFFSQILGISFMLSKIRLFRCKFIKGRNEAVPKRTGIAHQFGQDVCPTSWKPELTNLPGNLPFSGSGHSPMGKKVFKAPGMISISMGADSDIYFPKIGSTGLYCGG